MTTFIYAIHNATKNEVNIGCTTDPLRYLYGLQMTRTDELSLIYTFVGDAGMVDKLHSQLKFQEISDGWFRYCAKVLQTFTKLSIESRPEIGNFPQAPADREIILRAAFTIVSRKESKGFTMTELKSTLLTPPNDKELRDTLTQAGFRGFMSKAGETYFHMLRDKTDNLY